MKKSDGVLKVAPTKENTPRGLRYSVGELRALHNPSLVASCGVWPEEVETDLDDSFLLQSPSSPVEASTPASAQRGGRWGVGAGMVTPATAPARMRRDDQQQMATPMRLRTPSTKIKTQETDKRRLGQRGKQIQYGKSTLGYRLCRIQSATDDEAPADLPRTPREGQKCSKRCWDAQVREWRVKLHSYDPKSTEEWRVAFQLFPKETLELAAALDKNATQFAADQCLPPADIVEEARLAAAIAAKRGPVARSLNMDGGDDDDEDEFEGGGEQSSFSSPGSEMENETKKKIADLLDTP